MDKDTLTRLESLGIDVWVRKETAAELIQQGVAQSFIAQPRPEVRRPRRTTSSRPSFRGREINQSVESASKPATNRPPQQRKRRSTNKPEIESPPRQQSTPEQFEIWLNVFYYGSSSLIVEFDPTQDIKLVTDILKACSGFEPHLINRFEYRYPPFVDFRQNNKENYTLEGAQQGLGALFARGSKSVDQGTLIVIGERCSKVSHVLRSRVKHYIEIDALPYKPEDKKALWELLITRTN